MDKKSIEDNTEHITVSVITPGAARQLASVPHFFHDSTFL
jgi:hypothetical protein